MQQPTEDPAELALCRKQFERWEKRFFISNIRKRRKRILQPGEGRYFDKEVNNRWMAWQGCWDHCNL